MEISYVFPLGEGLELTQMERSEEQLILHVRATGTAARCVHCALIQLPACIAAIAGW
jgi:hypothetical protein